MDSKSYKTIGVTQDNDATCHSRDSSHNVARKCKAIKRTEKYAIAFMTISPEVLLKDSLHVQIIFADDEFEAIKIARTNLVKNFGCTKEPLTSLPLTTAHTKEWFLSQGESVDILIVN